MFYMICQLDISLFFILFQKNVLDSCDLDYYVDPPKEEVIDGITFDIKNKDNYLNNAIDILEKASKQFDVGSEQKVRMEVLKDLITAYEYKGDIKNQNAAYKDYVLLKDSVTKEDDMRRVFELVAEREDYERKLEEEKQKALIAEKINRRNNMQYLGLGAIVIFMGVLMLLQGRFKFREWFARALVFITFILTFEFLLVMIDPITDD